MDLSSTLQFSINKSHSLHAFLHSAAFLFLQGLSVIQWLEYCPRFTLYLYIQGYA